MRSTGSCRQLQYFHFKRQEGGSWKLSAKFISLLHSTPLWICSSPNKAAPGLVTCKLDWPWEPSEPQSPHSINKPGNKSAHHPGIRNILLQCTGCSCLSVFKHQVSKITPGSTIKEMAPSLSTALCRFHSLALLQCPCAKTGNVILPPLP